MRSLAVPQDPAGGTILPIPAAYRVASAAQYTGALASFDQDTHLATMMQAMADQVGGSVNILGVVGSKLKAKMSNFGFKRTVTAATEQGLTAFTMDAKLKTIIDVIDFFELDAGRIKTVASYNLACDETTGATTAYSTGSGVFIDPQQWEICYYEAPGLFKGTDLGGGPRGYVQAMEALDCLNPLAQMKVYTNS